jgi:hypothetical protein
VVQQVLVLAGVVVALMTLPMLIAGLQLILQLVM